MARLQRNKHLKRYDGTALLKQFDTPQIPTRFPSVDVLLDHAAQMFSARVRAANVVEHVSKSGASNIEDRKAIAQAGCMAEKWALSFHQSFEQSARNLHFCRLCKKRRFNRLEREVLLVLLLERLGLMNLEIRTCSAFIQLLHVSEECKLQVMRSLSEQGRLYKTKMINYRDEYEDLCDRDILLDPTLVDAVLFETNKHYKGWNVKTEQQLHDRLFEVTQALNKKADCATSVDMGYGHALSEFFKVSRLVEKMMDRFLETVRFHPNWGISRLHEEIGRPYQFKKKVIMLALLGKALGHISSDSEFFKGLSLARACATRPGDTMFNLRLFRSDSDLMVEGIIQPCGGLEEFVDDDPETIETIEYELSEKSLEILKIEKALIKKQRGETVIRKAKMSMGQLVLSSPVRDALKMAIAQTKNSKVLLDTWGLRKAIPYGRAMTVLFSGPPGVGKTACAEALAHELGRSILMVDYSQVQNCFVGQTEKNIVKTFRVAQKNNAVLFWDEADAMFFDRDSASRNWEVREVNVLLQELEKFEGLCILATNRKITLDPALERRISLKVEFDLPDREMRKQIWKRLLPKKMPLGRDVDLDALAAAELTGGEIKNAVLNAARIAVARDPKTKICMADFKQAITMETKNRWSRGKSVEIGFLKSN